MGRGPVTFEPRVAGMRMWAAVERFTFQEPGRGVKFSWRPFRVA